MISTYRLDTRLGAYLYEQRHFCPNGLVGFVQLEELKFLRGCADASGKYENLSDRILTVNGCVGTPDNWAAFDVEWQAYLAEVGYRKDCRSRQYVFHTSPFKNGSDPYMPERLKRSNRGAWVEAEKKVIYIHLVELICKYQEFAFGYGVLISDFRRIEEDFPYIRKFALNEPGTMLTHLCIKWNRAWVHHQPVKKFQSEIDYVLDYGDDYLPSMEQDYKKRHKEKGAEGLSILGFDPSKHAYEYSPLQAADVVAWECQTYWKQRFYHPVRMFAPKLPPSMELQRLGSKADTIRLYGYDEIKSVALEWFLDNVKSPTFVAEEVGHGKKFATVDDAFRQWLVAKKQYLDQVKAEQVAAAKAKKKAKKRARGTK
jgi:hypothetical protein